MSVAELVADRRTKAQLERAENRALTKLTIGPSPWVSR